jgi:hypothetical protein
MDDVTLLAPTRHKLPQAVRLLNQAFTELGLEKHPDKTFIGRAERGFDFLGYHLAPDRLTLARATVERFLERAHRLLFQDCSGVPSLIHQRDTPIYARIVPSEP